MTGIGGQLASLVLSIAREAVRLTPGVTSLLVRHSAATLAVGLVLAVMVLIARYAAVPLAAALAIALLFSAATWRQAPFRAASPAAPAITPSPPATGPPALSVTGSRPDPHPTARRIRGSRRPRNGGSIAPGVACDYPWHRRPVSCRPRRSRCRERPDPHPAVSGYHDVFHRWRLRRDVPVRRGALPAESGRPLFGGAPHRTLLPRGGAFAKGSYRAVRTRSRDRRQRHFASAWPPSGRRPSLPATLPAGWTDEFRRLVSSDRASDVGPLEEALPAVEGLFVVGPRLCRYLAIADQKGPGPEMTTPADIDLQRAVTAEFLALAGLLDTLPDAGWDTPSLCDGWRVREVVAHLTMPARYSAAQFGAELRDCGGDFTRLSNRVASRDAALSRSTLVDTLRQEVMHHWAPPGGGYAGALNHVVIHGLDISMPLGVPRRSPDDTIHVVLDDLTTGGTHAHFGVDITGLSLRATDIDWTFGSGTPISGAAEDVALFLCGRKLPPGRIHGAAPGELQPVPGT